LARYLLILKKLPLFNNFLESLMIGQPMNIIVVDDEPFIREVMVDFLHLHGYRVTSFKSGEDAVSEINTLLPDMVLLDIWMPGMSGLETLEKIRKENKNVGVVMLSAFGDDETMGEAMNMGADYYLQKPIEFKKLIKILDSWKTIHDL
jgi:DNA-binding response OmpR family regulator